MLSILNQPYPYYNSTDKLFKNSVAILVLVFLFLYLFRPFGVNEDEHKYSYAVICFIHALNAAVVYGVYFILLNTFGAAIVQEDNWKVYKTIVSVSIVFLLIGLGSFLLRELVYNNPDNFSWHYFVSETVNTFLAGTVVIAAFTLVDFYRLLQHNKKAALGVEQQIEEHKATTTDNNPPVGIVVENETYQLDLSEFFFARATGNYAEFYFNRNGTISKELKRISLKNIEEQLATLALPVTRTHRAFLVNTQHIKKIEGNAQGYQLYFDQIEFSVPVSRAQLLNFKRVMEAS